MRETNHNHEGAMTRRREGPDSVDRLRIVIAPSRRRGIVVVAGAVVVLSLPGAALRTDPRTLRLDYYHTGTATTEVFSLDRLVVEPTPWPGNPARPVDDTNLGQVPVRGDRPRVEPRRLLARLRLDLRRVGDAPARRRPSARTFHESLRFPMPAAPVQVVVKKRDRQNAFREAWSTTVDPADLFVDRAAPPSPGP